MLVYRHHEKQQIGMQGWQIAFLMYPGCEMHEGSGQERPAVVVASQSQSMEDRRDNQWELKMQTRYEPSGRIGLGSASIHVESSARSQHAIDIFEATSAILRLPLQEESSLQARGPLLRLKTSTIHAWIHFHTQLPQNDAVQI